MVDQHEHNAPNPPAAGENAASGNFNTLVVMGVSGCGKSTAAAALAADLGWELGEGDDLHPESNLDKMASGIPLTDGDRWPWLDLVARWIRERQERGKPCVITCSALKRVYRDRLRSGSKPGLAFVHLDVPTDELRRRMTQREGHFMPPELLASQLDTLQPLEADEAGTVVDATAPAPQLIDQIRKALYVRDSSTN